MKKYLLLALSFYCLIGNAQTIGGHDYVDLGLPSGTKWATCNIGATSAEAYGSYFAWGETTQQKDNAYTWASYTWSNGSNTSLTKYCNSSNYGTVDNVTELNSGDDAATANWGASWCMPTREQYDELLNSSYTTSQWASQNGAYGALITSKMPGYTDKSIFLPTAGYCENGSQKGSGQRGYGYYWSKSLYTSSCSKAYALGFQKSGFDLESNGGLRYCGFSVRAVVAFLTNLQKPTDVSSVPVSSEKKSTDKKYMSKGKIIISTNDRKYDINGTEIK